MNGWWSWGKYDVAVIAKSYLTDAQTDNKEGKHLWSEWSRTMELKLVELSRGSRLLKEIRPSGIWKTVARIIKESRRTQRAASIIQPILPVRLR